MSDDQLHTYAKYAGTAAVLVASSEKLTARDLPTLVDMIIVDDFLTKATKGEK
jgi:hypothetical protein